MSLTTKGDFMQKTAPWQMLLAACLFAPQVVAGPAVTTRIISGGVNIHATAVVAADAQTLWSTLTDYNGLPNFVPGMTLSRVVSAPGAHPKLVEQKRDGGVLSLVLPDHVVLAMDEQPYGRIGFRSVSGWTAQVSGEWQLAGEGPMRLTYRARIVPVLPPPPLITERYVEDEVRLRMDALVREAERRMRSRRADKAGGV